jgi:hypothetical protein
MTNEKLRKSEAMCLKALDDMCEMLAKAMPSQSPMWGGVKASPNVPDLQDEQIFAARGSEAPLTGQEDSQQPQPEEAAAAGQGDPELPSVDPEVVRDLGAYTPEHLHSIVQNASQQIASALFDSIMAHQGNKKQF